MKQEFTPSWNRSAFLFQGGGALGAFQVGVYEALHNGGYKLDWVCGISIGAIHAAIIAGNKPENRIEKLKQFWQIISPQPLATVWDNWLEWLDMRRFYNQMYAQSTLFFGQPGFFQPQLINPHFILNGSPEQLSFYDTSALRDTLHELVDFKILNNGETRLTLSAVRLSDGAQVLFDNHQQTIKAEHIMASGALPPGFPAIKIGHDYYWDGGIVNNTPLEVVLNDLPRRSTLCFMIQLFDPEGKMPTNMDDVFLKQKDIAYASNYKRVIKSFCEAHDLRHALTELYDLLPEERKVIPRAREIRSMGCKTVMTLVRFHRHELETDLSSKDYAFSPVAIAEGIRMGYEQGSKAVSQAPWLAPVPDTVGVVLYDMSPRNRTKKTVFEHGKKIKSAKD